MFNFQGIERLRLSKLTPLIYLWMINILKVTHHPRDVVVSRNRTMFGITKMFHFQGIERLRLTKLTS